MRFESLLSTILKREEKVEKGKEKENKKKSRGLMSYPGVEPGAFCVLDRCDNRYTSNSAYAEFKFLPI